MERALTTTTGSAEETAKLAGCLGALLGPGDVLALIGELGTGKTCFVEGACRALGYGGRVRSPSYTMLNIYRARFVVYHFDLYRWDPQAGEVELGEWEELIAGDGVSFIEWADRLGGWLPAGALTLRLAHAGGTDRRLELSAPGPRLAELARALGIDRERGASR
jgi:tRNA threonylcarbamoyladenosine biosynthesis protein TsaE